MVMTMAEIIKKEAMNGIYHNSINFQQAIRSQNKTEYRNTVKDKERKEKV